MVYTGIVQPGVNSKSSVFEGIFMNYSIGQFSQMMNLSVHTLRYYEQLKLILPNRKVNGHRFYSEDDAAWIQFIKRLKDTGMPIKEIQKYANLRAKGDKTLGERMEMLKQHRTILTERINAMQEHLTNLDDKINYYSKEIKKKHLSK